MCMMHKIKNVKNKIINFSSKDLFLSIDYSKKVNLDKLIDLNSNYNFLDKKSNDLLKIKKYILSHQSLFIELSI